MSSAGSDGEKPKKRVLVVEDDDAIASMLVRVLSTSYEVSRARDGGEALAVVDEFKPQLVLLDVMMRGIDGYATAQQLRLLPSLRGMPIIFLTAKGGPMDVVKGIQAGARFYITKPFKMDDLLQKVRKALGE